MNGVERQDPDAVDAPRAPRGAGGWDARSEELLAAAAVPGPGRAERARAAVAKAARRGGADPVKALMHRHRELCARAVDPLEIAAGLEAHGVTDRTAARFRHRDVFALAEEMYARVPRDDDDGTGQMAPSTADDVRNPPEVPPGWALFALLPGAVCALALGGIALSGGGTRLGVGLGGAAAVAAALRIALRYGPLRATAPASPATRAWACGLLAYALLGDGLLAGVVAGGPDAFWTPSLAAALGLCLAVAPAIWCARLFAVRARGRLGASRGLDEFAASVRPLLLGVLALFLVALAALLVLSDAVLGAWGASKGALGGAAALGALLLLARLLAVYGFTRAPALLLGAAGTAEAAAVALVVAGRLPGCEVLARPVTAAVDAWGPGAVPALACGLPALALLVHATRTLTRASAHAGPGGAL
ncbi:hypothetical protein [Streptomyces sp. NPDC087300]|uniref:hypothetical protein n=1 Tax=Streptomyces sp. NPDC087300 TaxID=3365780 RepID=UPI003821255D